MREKTTYTTPLFQIMYLELSQQWKLEVRFTVSLDISENILKLAEKLGGLLFSMTCTYVLCTLVSFLISSGMASALRVADQCSNLAFSEWLFSRLTQTCDIRIGTPVSTLPGTWH